MDAQRKTQPTFIPLGLITENLPNEEKSFFGESYIRAFCAEENDKIENVTAKNFSKLTSTWSRESTQKDNTPKFPQSLSLNSTFTELNSFKKNHILGFKPDEVKKGYSRIKSQWEGCITEVLENSFKAILYDKSGEEYTAEFPINDISENDKKLIQKNNIFYWSIGYRTTKSHQKINEEILVFRRLPAWNNFDINKPSNKAMEYSEFFNKPDDEDSSAKESG